MSLPDERIPHIISEITRRDVLEYLLLRPMAYYGRLGLIAFLKRIWNLREMPSTDKRFTNAEDDISQHVVNNNDWEHEDLLFNYLDLLNCDDELFLKFIEQCVHPVVLTDSTVLTQTLSNLNKFLETDGYRLEIDTITSGKNIYKAISIDKLETSATELHYEVVLSYASEDRVYVETVAQHLLNKDVRVFYDKNEEVSLWGKDLTEHLDNIYRGKAKYCIMFISKHYGEKIWTSHERKSALARAIEEKEEYILPVRFDDTPIPGLRPTVAYVDLRLKSPHELSVMILQKLGRT